MGYDAWVDITHAPISRGVWNKIVAKIGNEIPSGWFFNEEEGIIESEDRSHNPDIDAVREIAEIVAKITGIPVSFTFVDEDGDYSEIVTPDGSAFEEKRVFETDIGNVSGFVEYLDAKMEKKILEMTKDWSEELVEQFNGTTFHVKDDKEVAVVVDREGGKVFFARPNGDKAYLTIDERLKLWGLVLKEVEEYNKGGVADE